MLRAWACCVMTRWARLSASVVARVQRSVRASQGLRADLGYTCKKSATVWVSVWPLEAAEETTAILVLSATEMSLVRLLVCLLPALLLMFSAAEAVAAPEIDYASLRADVVKAYAQQAAEMTQSLTVLQALSTDTAVMLTRLESACAK